MEQSKKLSFTIELFEHEQAAFLQLVHDFQSGRVRAATPAVDFAGASYADAAKAMMTAQSTSAALRQRIAADDAREPLDALADAEHLHALQSKRFAEGAPVGAVDQPGASIHQAGVEALQRLLKVAQGHSGQCRYVALFLLGLYNGHRFPFALTNFRALDERLYDDCMRVLRMDARACKQEVHMYFKNGGAIWEALSEDWCAIEHGRLENIAKDLIRRGVQYYGDDLEADLKRALRYREPERSDE